MTEAFRASRDEALVRLAEAQGRAGDAATAKATLAASADLIKTAAVDLRVEAALVLAGLGDVEAARAALASIFDEVCEMRAEHAISRNGALDRVALAQVRLGDHATALAVARVVEAGWHRDETLLRIAEAQARQGAYPAARATCNAMEDVIRRVRGLGIIADVNDARFHDKLAFASAKHPC